MTDLLLRRMRNWLRCIWVLTCPQNECMLTWINQVNRWLLDTIWRINKFYLSCSYNKSNLFLAVLYFSFVVFYSYWDESFAHFIFHLFLRCLSSVVFYTHLIIRSLLTFQSVISPQKNDSIEVKIFYINFT